MACLVVMAGICIVNVFMRYVLNMGLQWGEEITLVLVIWFTFIALALGMKLSLHININVLSKNLSPLILRALKMLRSLVTLAVGVVFLVYGIILVRYTSMSILPATMLPTSIMYLPVPIASVFIVYESVLDLFGLDQDEHYFEKKFNIEES
jgi:TRAP-type C4-dicarboxylate transport system permease small subunit